MFSFGLVPWFLACQAVVRCSRLLFFLLALVGLPWWEATEVAGAERIPFGISSVLLGVGVLHPVLLLMYGHGSEGEGQDGRRRGAVPLPPAGRGGEGRWRHSLARSATPACQVSGRLEDFELAWCPCSLPRLGDEMDVGFHGLLDCKSGRWCRGVEDVSGRSLHALSAPSKVGNGCLRPTVVDGSEVDVWRLLPPSLSATALSGQ
jgi:hypothetical protein